MVNRYSQFILATGVVVGGILSGSNALAGPVNLQLAPNSSSVCSVGGTVDLTLRVISQDTVPDPISAIAACLQWDPLYLRLLGIHDDAESPYQWLANFFPDDRTVDRVNDDRANNVFWSEQLCANDAQCSPLAGCDLGVPCSNDGDCRPETFCNLGETCGPVHCCDDSYCFYTGFPFNDGNALYEAWSQLFGSPAQATSGPVGLVVTKFTFQALQATPVGGTTVRINAECGPSTQTVVYDGDTPNENILGGIVNPAPVVHVGTLSAPTAQALGCRYISITPGPGTVNIALKVKGLTGNVTCVDHYVQLDGTLGPSAVYRTGTAWGTVLVKDERIKPDRQYRIVADCGTSTSAPVTVTTWPWGDTDDNQVIDLDDILHVLDGFIGFYFPPATFESCNLFPCEGLPGQEVMDLDDILSILDAFTGVDYKVLCPPVCP